MDENCIRIVEMEDSGSGSEKKYEIYETGSDVFCVIGVENNKRTQSKMRTSKPRYYKQSYREAWESMRDFKGWLSSVPGNTSKAYCKLCQKELHCHRLSLLKHKITFKHQKKEEEHKLSKTRDERNEVGGRVGMQNGAADGNVSRNESDVVRMDLNSDGDDESVILTQATTSKIKENEEEAKGKNDSLSTHVLDISRGMPGALIHLVLYKLIEGKWTLLSEGLTDSGGRHSFCLTKENEFSEGRYKLHYDVDKYFESQNQETMFPFIEVVFDVKDTSANYHIPLLLSPYGYSIYRGS